MKKLFSFIMIMILCLGLIGCSNGTEEVNGIVSKLESITELDDREEEITFLYKSENNVGTFKKWTLNYKSENEFVCFWDNSVDEIFFSIFGENCKSDIRNESFSYDLSEDEIRIYFNPDYTDGIEIINYNIGKEEFILNKDGDKYNVSDEFLQFVEDSNLITIIQTNLQIFETKLKNNDLSIEDISKLNYKDIKDCI